MSLTFLGLMNLVFALLILLLKEYLMLKTDEVEKPFQKEVRDNRFATTALIIIFCFGSIISFIINCFNTGTIFPDNPVNDLPIFLKWSSIFFITFGLYLLIAREKFLEGLRNKFYKIPKNPRNNRKVIVYIGIGIEIIGVILFIKYFKIF